MVAMTMKNFMVQNDYDFCKNAHFQMVIQLSSVKESFGNVEKR